jgi:HlyD family secretion protein
MAVDLEILRLDLPEEDFSKPDGVSRFWRFSTLLLVLAVGGLVWLHWVHEPDVSAADRVPVRAHTVSHAAAAQHSSFTAGGWVEPAWPYPVRVSPRVNGVVMALMVVPGQDISAGELVAMLDDEPLRSELAVATARVTTAEHELARANAQLAALQAGARPEELELAKAELARAESALERLKAGFQPQEVAAAEARWRGAKATAAFLRARADRYRTLGVANLIPGDVVQEHEGEALAAEEAVESLYHDWQRLLAGPREVELEESRADVRTAERRLELLQAGTRPEDITAARAATHAARARVDTLRAEVSAIDQRIGWCMVEAPEDGRVLELLTKQGARVNDDFPDLLTLYDPGHMQVRADIRQEQSARLFIGQEVSIRLEARTGNPYRGRLIRIDPLGNLARDTVRVRVQILDPDEHLRQDLTVTTDFMPHAAEDEPAAQPLVIPRSAVQRREGKAYAFVIRGGNVHMTEIELGDEIAAGVIVTAGLNSGDVLAASGLPMLSDGAAVELEGEAG